MASSYPSSAHALRALAHVFFAVNVLIQIVTAKFQPGGHVFSAIMSTKGNTRIAKIVFIVLFDLVPGIDVGSDLEGLRGLRWQKGGQNGYRGS